MSGEGVIAARPPFVVGRLGNTGEWQVLLMVPAQPPVWEREVEVLLDPDEAERLARHLVEYAALVRDKTGLPCRPTASLPEAGPGGKVMP